MNKCIVLGIVFSLVLMSFPSISGNQLNNQIIKPSVRGGILYVGGSGEGNYSKIQNAVNNASNGDTVFVYNGTYRENVVIDKSINLFGECREKTFIFGYWFVDAVINITADWVNISEFSISRGDKIGIKLYSDYNTISYNNLFDELRTGIEICSNFNIIKDNNISQYWVYGIYLSNFAFSNSINGNNITGENFDQCSGITLSDNCNHNTITDNVISVNLLDIYIHSSFNNTISSNIIRLDGWTGIRVESSRNNIILNNQFLKNLHCMGIYYSNNNTVKGNTFSNISCCTCLHIYYSNDNILIDNNIFGNGACTGINLDNHSLNNLINGNNITKSGYGINIKSYSNNNLIYHNNFIDNSRKANDECNNTWDDGKYGNYWSDYEERYPDAKPKLFKSWMWDTPYEIEGGDNQDNCPLIKQWPNSASKDITSNKVINRPILNFLQYYPNLFPLLQILLDIWRDSVE